MSTQHTVMYGFEMKQRIEIIFDKSDSIILTNDEQRKNSLHKMPLSLM